MTGLEKIVKQIQDEAQQAAGEALAQAKAQAQQILEQAQAEAQAQVEAIRQKSESDLANASSAAQSAAELTRRRAVLAAKQQMIGETIDAAQQAIYQLPAEEYFDLILRMVEKFSLPQEGEIFISSADLARLPADFDDRLQKAAKGTLKRSNQPRAIDGGFVLTYGGVEENCSIEALFYAAREELQDRVHALLFS